METDYEFSKGNQVLVYYGELLYEGKVLNRRTTNTNEIQYYIHYKGYNTRWDQWIDADDVLAHNEINLGHMQRAKTRYYKSKNSKPLSAAANKNKCIKQLLRKRGRPKKTVNKCKNDKDPKHDSAVQSAEHSHHIEAAEYADSVKAAEHAAIVQAVSNIVTNVIKFSMSVGNNLNALKLPLKMKNILIFDYIMIRKHNKIIQFSDTHYIAQVIYSFHKACDFENKHIKQNSLHFCVTLLQTFNELVHQHLLYSNEKLNGFQNKGMSHFQKRLIKQPSISYVYKNYIFPKKVWCYVYGPRYLLRLLVMTYLWKPQSDFFADYVNAFLEFLEANCDTYFSDDDYYV